MTNCILMSISSFLILVCQFLEKIMSEENNNQSLPADKSEKSPVIIIEGKSSGSSHKICKSIGKVLLTIGSIITFARNLVFNLIFLLLILAIFSGIYFANNALEHTSANAFIRTNSHIAIPQLFNQKQNKTCLCLAAVMNIEVKLYS